MATTSINYGSNTSITFDVSSLGASSTFLSGRESTQIDNTSNKYNDYIVTCDGITGNTGSAPTVGQQIQLYAWGSDVSLATTAIDALDGTDSAASLGHVSVLQSLRLVAAPTVTVATAGLKYYIMPFSIAALFNDVVPKFWGLYLAHNHTAALAASQSGIWSYYGVKYDIA